MDQSYSESDISLSPSQILERLQVLRQLQLLQRGKLHKQRLEYQETSENTSSITEIVSHFSNSTSYNTFRSLLQSPLDSSNDATPRCNVSNLSKNVKERDLLDGVSVLNLSQESEFIVNSPMSNKSKLSAPSRSDDPNSPSAMNAEGKLLAKKHISLDDMPILSPKKDFEALIIDKLKVDDNATKPKSPKSKMQAKRPFLKKGEGMSRFGLRKKDLVIQNTKSLPWRKQSLDNKPVQSPVSKVIKKLSKSVDKKVTIDILVNDSPKPKNGQDTKIEDGKIAQRSPDSSNTSENHCRVQSGLHIQALSPTQLVPKLSLPKGNHPLHINKGKTWAAVLTKEQNDFLRQLKQSNYYKNFASPSKSTISDVSCDETLTKLRQEREMAEQNMFDLLEHKVSNESFNLENSFFHKFLTQSKLEYSGESTPLVMQQCLTNNPNLIHLHPEWEHRKRSHNYHSNVEPSEYTDCCSETCSTVSSCCSCKTTEETNTTVQPGKNKKNSTQKGKSSREKEVENKEVVKEPNKDGQNDIGTVNQNDSLQINMVEMNAKLITTSELLKDRLRELEDEIETFRQENANLTKMREEIDSERQKFYEEKAMFEQKFNEDKILSEYYLAEEKEKLTKQKQMYEKYVREMRGRLNKKDKDEVLNLKKEINDLKEEIRLKDAKSTSTIARLRNQLKFLEKEKKDFEEQIEKLKKENRRIQHSNDMTRRMTNIKYLEEINKKLSHMTAKDTQSEVNMDSNAKYKAFEIESQSRSRKLHQNANNNPVLRTRAKSVPNLKVTSRYAKYFSQRDVVSDLERNKSMNTKPIGHYNNDSDNDDIENEILHIDRNDLEQCDDSSDHESENNLEKLYMERFRSVSPRSSKSNLSSNQNCSQSSNPDTFFISKPSSNRDSRSPCNNVSPFNNSNNSNRSTSTRSKSPTSLPSHRSSEHRSPRVMSEEINTFREKAIRIRPSNSQGSDNRQSKSPVSILTNRSSSIQKPGTVIHNDQYRDKMTYASSDPSSSKTSLLKTNLNPTEIRKPDGSRELRFPNGNVKFLSADGKYSKFVYYNGDVKENFYDEGRIKYFYAEPKTYHTTHADGLEVLEFPE